MLLVTVFLLSQTLHLERLPITVNRPVDARFAPHTDLGAMATSDAAFTAPVGFFQDKAGELYVIDLSGADLFKLTP